MDRFEELMFLVEKTSKKEQHRIDKFLKRHNYDPKTGTIETDEVDKDGKKLRVKFNMTNGPEYSDSSSHSYIDGKYVNSEINMPRKSLKRKPMYSDGTLKHEEGHVAYKRNPEKYKELYDKAKKAIEDDKTDKDSHGKNPEEYVADWYSAKHSKYGLKGLNKEVNCTKFSDKQIKDMIKKTENYYRRNKDLSSDEIRQLEGKIKEIKKKVRQYKDSIPKNEKELRELKSSNESEGIFDDHIRDLEDYIEFQKRTIKEYPQKIKELEKNISNAKNTIRSPKATSEMLNDFRPLIQQSSETYGRRRNNEMNLRQKFVNDNIKESTDVLLDIYEAEYNGDITPEERDILVNYLREKK